MTTRQTPDAVREALRAQHDWHYEKAKALSKQPQTADVQWRRNEHREQIDAIAFALSALDSRAGDAGEAMWRQTALDVAKDCQRVRHSSATPQERDTALRQAATMLRSFADATTPAPAVDDDDIDSPAARLDMVRVALSGIIDNPASAVPLARAGLDFCDLTQAQRQEMRGDA